MFTKVQIYTNKKSPCFSDIRESRMPFVLINVDDVSSLGPRDTWGFCEGNSNYPYRVLVMKNGDKFICVLESANSLEKLLLQQELPKSE